MKPEFVWEQNPPERSSKSVIEDAFRACLQHYDTPVAEQVAKIYLRLDRIGWTVEGVGWSAGDKKRLFVFEYSTTSNKSSCSLYIDPNLWYSKVFANAADGLAETNLIQEVFMVGYVSSGNAWSYALFSRYDPATGSSTLYFAPPTRTLALRFGATPCETPQHADENGLSLIAGDQRAFNVYFKGQERVE